MHDLLLVTVQVMLHQEDQIYLTMQIVHLDEMQMRGILTLPQQETKLVKHQKLELL